MQLLPFSLLALLLASSAAASGATHQHFPILEVEPDYQWPDHAANGSRISVGYEAAAGDYPNIVGVFPPNVLCGGTLIAPNVVLTAAHCFNGITRDNAIKNTKLYVGLLSITTANIAACNKGAGGCDARTITDLIIHPGYSQTNSVTVADLAILILNTPSTIAPLPMAKSKPDSGKTEKIAGWGRMQSTQEPATNLMFTNVATLPDAGCSFLPYYDSQSSICTTSSGSWPNDATATACQGDSGGPLYNMDVSPPQLFGVGSYIVQYDSTDKCGSYLRTVFMSVSYYADWINSVLASNPVPAPVPSPSPSPTPVPSPIPSPQPMPSPQPRPSPSPTRRSPPPQKRKPPPPSKKKPPRKPHA